MTDTAEPTDQDQPDARSDGEDANQPQRELRVALAMRGGVSLAVWIGGAVSELDLARRGVIAARLADTERASFWGAALPDEIDRASIYAEVLSKLGYTSISFDVLAGASAGGLNAAIYGLAQSVGKDIDWLRKVSEDQGDLAKLLHATWDPRHPYRTEALLRRRRRVLPDRARPSCVRGSALAAPTCRRGT